MRGVLDAWVNITYRALKDARAGRERAARLNGGEAVPMLLDVLFALEGRVRPYNTYLEWWLARHPLSRITTDALLALLDRIAAGEAAALHDSLELVREACERYDGAHEQTGLVALLDSWTREEAPALYRDLF